ncbi:MAG: DUF4079 domain-containing protein [Prochloron sp. SP5CPC1]|nr:DUF4079 domain-containing protein [Candidatus Paraprochloron terpiosi SP5CPC1]
MDVETLKSWSQFGHPILMWVLLAITLYAGYLGLQVRRTRTADKETRKELVPKQFHIKHYQLGSILLALVVLGTIGGMAVTYINNGKLFVGPHLLTGLSMTGIIAISVSLVPLMQKGSDAARYAHIALNASLVGLFGWQALTGIEIVQKIVSNF